MFASISRLLCTLSETKGCSGCSLPGCACLLTPRALLHTWHVYTHSQSAPLARPHTLRLPSPSTHRLDPVSYTLYGLIVGELGDNDQLMKVGVCVGRCAGGCLCGAGLVGGRAGGLTLRELCESVSR